MEEDYVSELAKVKLSGCGYIHAPAQSQPEHGCGTQHSLHPFTTQRPHTSLCWLSSFVPFACPSCLKAARSSGLSSLMKSSAHGRDGRV